MIMWESLDSIKDRTVSSLAMQQFSYGWVYRLCAPISCSAGMCERSIKSLSSGGLLKS